MFPVSGLHPNKRKMALPGNGKKANKPVDEAQSKNIMSELFNELDEKDADELQAAAANGDQALNVAGQVVNENGQVALSKHEEMAFKAANLQSKPTVEQAAVRFLLFIKANT